MKELNYKKILERLVEESSEHLTDWEHDFITNVLYQWHGEYTEKQKETIIKINRKIRTRG